MKKIFISMLVLVSLTTLAREVNACKEDGEQGKMMGFLDTNKDGKLSNVEMQDGAVRMVKKHDVNNDGVVTITEVKNDVNAKFKDIDKNSDGFADKAEFREHYKAKFKELRNSKK